MGRNNQQRRAAKTRKKQRQRRRGSDRVGVTPHDDVPPMDELVRAAALAWGADDIAPGTQLDAETVPLGVVLLALRSRLGSLPTTVPPPGQTSAAAAADGRLLPVLRARHEKVEAAVAAAFPHLEHRSGAISHGTGFAAGQAAADLAGLDVSTGALDDAPAS